MATEAQIVERAQRGDRIAFGELVARYRGLVFGLCRGMTDSVADAEDLTHDAFIEAFLKLDGLREPASFLPWLRTLTLNLCRMWLRQGTRALTGVPDTPEADVEEVERLFARLTGELTRLPHHQQTALLLQYWEGLTYEEIAAFLDIPVGTVMSRLHRARQQLKTRMESMAEDDEVPMVPDEEFQAALNAEIDLLLSLVTEEESRERLRVILARTPERFGQMIASVAPEQVDDLAIVLTRLGGDAIDAALTACFAEDEALRERARLLLQRLLARGKGRPRTGKARGLPLRAEATLLLDRLIRFDQPDSARVELLMDVMAGADDEATEALLAGAMLSYPKEALRTLFARWRDDSNDEPWLARALCRSGEWLLRQLLPELTSGEEPRTGRALALLDRFAERFDRKWMQDLSPLHREIEVRARGVLTRDEIDRNTVDDVLAAVAPLTRHPDGEMAASALKVVGALAGRACAESVRAALDHPAASARLAAVQVLRDIDDPESGEAILQRLADEDAAVRRMATLALGALRVEEARATLEELIRAPDADIARSAVIALGEFGDDRSAEVLKSLVASADKRLAKAAAGALYGGRRPGYKQTELTRERLQRVRGDATPPLHLSTVGAIRGLPELREYEEREITHLIAQVCSDYSATRRHLVMDRSRALMTRAEGIYRLTPLGEAVWRVERFIKENYLR